MAKYEQRPWAELDEFLPEGASEKVLTLLHKYHVHLTVTRERKSILGNYRNAVHGKNHRITVNGNLNKYSFLITLIHEIAHLLTFEQYGHKVLAHGNEWKNCYGYLLKEFIESAIFPEDIRHELKKSSQNPAASSCAEEGLTRILKRYDVKKPGIFMIEEIPSGSHFITKDGKVFQKGEKLRKRFRGTELRTGAVYLFSPLYEVKLIEQT